MTEPDGPSLPRLLADAFRESADLARKEIALFRTEVSANVRTIVTGFVMMLAAAVFAILSLIWLTQALVDWLATKVGSHALAALIVGGGLAVVAIAVGLIGRSAVSKTSLAPTRTVHSLQRDAEVLTERVSG